MIEVRICAKENKKYAGIYGAYTKGQFCWIAGEFSAAQVASLNYGQAEAGMLRLIECTGGVQNVVGKVFPIDKLIFTNENSETTYDTLTSGDQVIYYDAGRFATDIYDGSTISGETALGTLLYVNATGYLTATAHAEAPGAIAVLVGHEAVGTTNYFNGTALYGRDMIVYDLL